MEQRILQVLLKDFRASHTVTSLADEMKVSRVGMWKILKRMQTAKLLTLSKSGKGKTSMYMIRLNWDNPIVEKKLALGMAEDAQKHRRWIANFTQLEAKVDFLLLFGSILHSPQDAKDIDIIMVSAKETEKDVQSIQKTQIRKIHAIQFTSDELKQELEKPNKAIVDAVKKGTVLFGQEKFISFMRGVRA